MYNSVFLVLVCFSSPVWTDEWIEHFSYLDIDYNMNCSLPDTGTMWYLSNGQIVKANNKFGLNGNLLLIKKVTAADTGIYVCKTSGINETSRQVHTLNVGGPMYHSISEQYYLNIVIGVVSGVAMFFVVSGLYLVNKYRYRNPKHSMFEDEEMSHVTKL